jgi:hypothetical protein
MENDPDISAFEKQFSSAFQKGANEIMVFLKSLMEEGEPREAVLEFALRRMENFSGAESYLVAYYCCLIIQKYGGASKISRVEKIRSSLPPLPGLRDYRVDYDNLLEILEARENGMCECAVKIRYNTHPSDPLFSTISCEFDSEAYLTRYLVKCNQCEKIYKVTEDIGYHYPLFQWSRQ